jgi:hypothetical protein
MLNFKLVLPAPSAQDVVTREVTVQIAGQEPTVDTLPGEALEMIGLSGNDGDTVSGSLVDIDDAGNRSESRNFDFVLADTIAPPQPGEVSLIVTSEE